MICRAARAAVLAVALSVIAGCTVVVPGSGAPARTAGSGPVIPEGPAEWAVSTLDPCALLDGAPVAATGRPYLTRPHNCGLDYTWPDGRESRLVVRVGVSFTTTDRAHAGLVTVGGLTAYQARDTEENPYEEPECVVDIPISATRSIQVSSMSLGGELDGACAGARAAAEPVAAKLAAPTELASGSPPNALGRRTACVLLEDALGYVAEDDGSAGPHADDCRATPPESRLELTGPSVQIVTEAGPDALPQQFPGDTVVNLPLGPALQESLSTSCDLTFVAERQPGAPPEYAAQVMKLTQRDSPDPCADAVAAATAIQNTLGTPAAEPPPAPDRLGFRSGEPDDVMPAPCGLYGNTTPATCRAPRPVDPPATAQEILALGADPRAADVSCAILRAAAEPVVGRLELAASGEGGCIGLGYDGYAINLGFYAASAAGEYCQGLDREDVQIGGRPGTRCTPSASTFNLILPATGRPDQPGVLLVDGLLDVPRGSRTISLPEDEPRVRDLTTRITENVINRYLSA